MLRELLDSDRLLLSRLLHSFLFLIRRGQVAAVDHVELVLRDAFVLQLLIAFVGKVREIGVLFLQRRDAILTEGHGAGGRRDFRWRQGFRFVLARRRRRSVTHVLKSRDDAAFVFLNCLQDVGARVLCFFVALEVIDILNRFRHVLS